MNRDRISDSIEIQSELTGSTEGSLRAVQKKEAGGIPFARRLDTAVQPVRPESAGEGGGSEFFLSAEEIARKIVRFAHAVSRAERGSRHDLGNRRHRTI